MLSRSVPLKHRDALASEQEIAVVNAAEVRDHVPTGAASNDVGAVIDLEPDLVRAAPAEDEVGSTARLQELRRELGIGVSTIRSAAQDVVAVAVFQEDVDTAAAYQDVIAAEAEVRGQDCQTGPRLDHQSPGRPRVRPRGHPDRLDP